MHPVAPLGRRRIGCSGDLSRGLVKGTVLTGAAIGPGLFEGGGRAGMSRHASVAVKGTLLTVWKTWLMFRGLADVSRRAGVVVKGTRLR